MPETSSIRLKKPAAPGGMSSANLGAFFPTLTSSSYYRLAKRGVGYADDVLRHADDISDIAKGRRAGKYSEHFRGSLTKYTGKNYDGNVEAHNIFPKAFRDKFLNRYHIDVNNPKYGAWVDSNAHRHWSSAYNREWKDFLNKNPTYDQVLEFGRHLGRMPRYGFETFF